MTKEPDACCSCTADRWRDRGAKVGLRSSLLSCRMWKQVSRGTKGCGGGEAEGSWVARHREV